MTYELYCYSKALKKWGKLERSIKNQFKKKLIERLDNSRVKKDKLEDYNQVYKIKLKKPLAIRATLPSDDNKTVIFVIVVGKREYNKIYNILKQRYQAK